MAETQESSGKIVGEALVETKDTVVNAGEVVREAVKDTSKHLPAWDSSYSVVDGIDDAIHTTPPPATSADGAPKESAIKKLGAQIKEGFNKTTEAIKSGWNSVMNKMKKEDSVEAAERKVDEVEEKVKEAVSEATN